MSERPIDPARTLVMACATVIEEMLPLLPAGMSHKVFDFGLHVNPGNLHRTLQTAIDGVDGAYDTLILGYGLCSLAIVGLKAAHCRIVVPRVDDCIAIFLGSHSAYRQQARAEPGTYYLTKGWIEVGDTPFSEYDRLVERYGLERAKRIFRVMLMNYKRLALINTGLYSMERYREVARGIANRFGLRYEELEGSTNLVEKMINGPWDDEFVVVGPGQEIRYNQFTREVTSH
ncbi:MAG TPA: DUF1638 domain-containing protein, partial [Spirochaetia bacterium]|nr:DUF1638 domain-containing protein [Spirochaetia bacterium]